MKETQVERLIKWLRANPGSSSFEITMALHCINVTGRISDIRKIPGLDVECRTVKGVARYYLREAFDGTLGLDHVA